MAPEPPLRLRDGTTISVSDEGDDALYVTVRNTPGKDFRIERTERLILASRLLPSGWELVHDHGHARAPQTSRIPDRRDSLTGQP
jgi:hypothetical protein